MALSPVLLPLEEFLYAVDHLNAKRAYKRAFTDKKPFFELSQEDLQVILNQARTFRYIIKQKEILSLRETQFQYMLQTSLFTYGFWERVTFKNDLKEVYDYFMPLVSFTLSTCSLLNIAKLVNLIPRIEPQWLFLIMLIIIVVKKNYRDCKLILRIPQKR